MNYNPTHHHGDNIKRKTKNTTRILSININTFPKNSANQNENVKLQLLQSLIKETEPDILATQEDNCYWPNIPTYNRPKNKCKKWFSELKIASTYNTLQSPPGTHLQGGQSVWLTNDMAHRYIQEEKDPKQMGRWIYQSIKGKNGQVIRIYSAYRPCVSHGENTIYAQQTRGLTTLNDTRCPRVAFLEDLKTEIETANDKQEWVILAMDANTDITTKEIENFARTVNLINPITERHGSEGPPTYMRGSKQIDAILISPQIRIEECGYLPHIASPSDHRVLWIDIKNEGLLGTKRTTMTQKHETRLKMDDDQCKKKFRKIFKQTIKTENIENLIDNQFQIAKESPTQVCQETIDHIFQKITKAAMHAEKKCRKIKAGKHDWSPDLKKAQSAYTYWKLVTKARKGEKVCKRTMKHKKRETPTHLMRNAEEMNEEEIQEMKRRAGTNLRTTYKRSEEKRTEYLHKLCQTAALENNMSVIGKIKQKQHQEQQRKINRYINSCTEKMNLAMKEAEIPNDWDNSEQGYTTCTDKEEIEYWAIHHIHRNFRQIYDTPPCTEPFVDEFGLIATNQNSEQVLNGTYNPPDEMNEHMKIMLRQLKKPENMTRVTTIISTRELQDATKIIKERTSASPFGCRFAQIKAAAEDEGLATMMAKLISIPMLTGNPPKIYSRVTACFLLKRAGIKRIDKMRTIWLLNAFFGITGRIIARRLRIQTYKHKMGAKEDFGGKKGFEASMQSTNIRMAMDIARQKRQTTLIKSVDLTNCFDRISHGYTSLNLLQKGFDKETIEMRFKTVHQLQVHVRTAYGDSVMHSNDGRWQVPDNQPFQGTLQGAADSMELWGINNAEIIKAMKAEGHAPTYTTAIGNKSTDYLGFHYVDDGTQITQARHGDLRGLNQRTQHSMRDLDGFVKATGQAINTAKTYYWIIDYEWKNGSPKVKDGISNDFRITCRDKHNQITQIQQVKANEARELLGAYICPIDDGETMKKAIIEKIDKWAAQMKNAKLTPKLSWIATNTRLMKAIEWPLVISNLSEKQCQQISTRLLAHCLRPAGIQRNINRKILYASMGTMGLQMPCIYTTMGIQKIKHIINHGGQKNLCGEMIQLTYEQTLMELGIQGQLFRKDYQKWKHIATKTWLTSCWEFCSKYNIEIKPSEVGRQTREKNDRMLMEIIMDMNLTTAQIKAINRCRLYQRISTLSDALDLDGRYVRHAVKNPFQHEEGECNRWPYQKLPPRNEWTLWKSTLEKIDEWYKRQAQKIRRWDEVEDAWEWFADTTHGRLYQRTNTGWLFYIHHGRGDRLTAGYFTGGYTDDNPPDNLHRARVQKGKGNGRVYCTEIQTAVTATRNGPTINTLAEAIAQENRTTKNLLRNIIFSEQDLDNIAVSIRNGTARMVSDGSYIKETGKATFSLILESQDKASSIKVTGIVLGNPEDNDSYRAECTGLLAGIILIRLVCQLKQIETGKVTIGCDGKSALEKVVSENELVNSKEKHHDILTLARDERGRIPVILKKHWVKGHQDEHTRYAKLDRMTQLNVTCDRRARKLAEEQNTDEQLTEIVESSRWELWVAGKRVVNDFDRIIRRHIHDPDMKERWTEKGRLQNEHIEMVDWDVTQMAAEQTAKRRHTIMVKLCTENAPTNDNMCKWGFRQSTKCPRCGYVYENAIHVVKCRSEGATEVWNKSMKDLDRWMKSTGTRYNTRVGILRYLKAWRMDDPIRETYSAGDPFDAQNRIGWDNFIFGIVSRRWAVLQQKEYEKRLSRRTGRRWAAALVQKLWDVSWDQWQHRNAVLHSGDKEHKYHDPERLAADIRREVLLGAPISLPRHLRHWFSYSDADQVFRKSAYDQRLWLETVQQIRRMMTERLEMDGYAGMRRNLHEWLRRDDSAPGREWIK